MARNFPSRLMRHLFLETLRNFLAIHAFRPYSPNEAPVHTGRPGGRSEYVRPAAGHRTAAAPAGGGPRGGRIPQERGKPEPQSRPPPGLRLLHPPHLPPIGSTPPARPGAPRPSGGGAGHPSP